MKHRLACTSSLTDVGFTELLVDYDRLECGLQGPEPALPSYLDGLAGYAD